MGKLQTKPKIIMTQIKRQDGESWTETQRCQRCESPFQSSRIWSCGRAMFIQVFCGPCQDARKAERDATNLRYDLAQWSCGWRSKCPKEFQQTNPGDPRLNQVALKKVLGWEMNPKGLVLHGATGKGKTRASWLLIKQLIMSGKLDGDKFEWMTAADFCDRSSASSAKGEAYDFLYDLKRAQLLFIDDFGKGKMTERNAGAFFNVMDHRFSNHLPVILTMNYCGKDLVSRLDSDMADPLMRRLIEFCNIIDF